MCGMMLEKKQLLENVRLKNTELSKALDTVNRMQDTILESGKLAVVGALTRGLCHTLNNKLVPILGYAQILGIAMSPGSPEADKLRIVETAAFDIKKILDNMHMLATGINMPFTNTDVSEVIDSCLQMQDYLFQENEIIVLRDYTQCDPVAHLHRERLVQAFLALFHRLAQMFQTCPGKHEVRITLGRTAEHLLVIIRDNGRVLPPEQLALLERPFDQGNPFENERLNFSIARSVIKDHQGLFEVDSSKELGGTRVTMYFPVTRPHSS
jgi:signal transduction histidine kinase